MNREDIVCRTFWYKDDLNSKDNQFEYRGICTNKDRANLVSSATPLGTHLPVLDIDFPVRAVPSTTPGHFHLYIDKELTPGQYDLLLTTLRDIGIIEPGFYNAWKARGMTMVRKPGEKKPPGAPPSTDVPDPPAAVEYIF